MRRSQNWPRLAHFRKRLPQLPRDRESLFAHLPGGCHAGLWGPRYSVLELDAHDFEYLASGRVFGDDHPGLAQAAGQRTKTLLGRLLAEIQVALPETVQELGLLLAFGNDAPVLFGRLAPAARRRIRHQSVAVHARSRRGRGEPSECAHQNAVFHIREVLDREPLRRQARKGRIDGGAVLSVGDSSISERWEFDGAGRRPGGRQVLSRKKDVIGLSVRCIG